MVLPFDSSRFFADDFFTKPSATDAGTVTITRRPSGSSSSGIPCIYRRGLDPARHGGLIAKGGEWGELSVLISDFVARFGGSTTPAHGDEWTVDNQMFRVDQWEKSGDCFIVQAVYNQRMKV